MEKAYFVFRERVFSRTHVSSRGLVIAGMRGFHAGVSFLMYMAKSVASSFMSVSRVWLFPYSLIRGISTFVSKKLLSALIRCEDSGYFRNMRGVLALPHGGLEAFSVKGLRVLNQEIVYKKSIELLKVTYK